MCIPYLDSRRLYCRTPEKWFGGEFSVKWFGFRPESPSYRPKVGVTDQKSEIQPGRTPESEPNRPGPEKQTVSPVTAISQNANPASTFELSQCRHCKEGLPGPRGQTALRQSVPQNGHVHLHIIEHLAPEAVSKPPMWAPDSLWLCLFFSCRKRAEFTKNEGEFINRFAGNIQEGTNVHLSNVHLVLCWNFRLNRLTPPSMPSFPPPPLWCFYTMWFKVGNHELQERSSNAEISRRRKCTFERWTFVPPWDMWIGPFFWDDEVGPVLICVWVQTEVEAPS